MAETTVRIKFGADHEIEVSTGMGTDIISKIINETTEKFFPGTTFVDKKINL